MTDQNELEVVAAPLVRVAIANEDDYVVPFSDVDEYGNYDPATINDNDMIQITAQHMDLTVEELAERVYGGRAGNLKVSRPETGNIVIRPETRLG